MSYRWSSTAPLRGPAFLHVKSAKSVGDTVQRWDPGRWDQLGLLPTQDASHQQDYETFLVGNPNLNLEKCHCYWVGG